MSIEAMKQALEALENPWKAGAEGVADAIVALRQAIESAEKPSTGNVLMDAYNEMVAKQQRAEKQEPVAWITAGKHTAPLKMYAAPVDAVNMKQERVDETAKGEHEWVGLMDEEINALARWADEHAAPFHLEFAKAIEAKLKEKNNG